MGEVSVAICSDGKRPREFEAADVVASCWRRSSVMASCATVRVMMSERAKWTSWAISQLWENNPVLMAG